MLKVLIHKACALKIWASTMIKNRAPMRRNLSLKLTRKQKDSLKPGRASDQDIIEDTKETYNFLTHILLGALIEPDRDRERWVRRCMRDALAAGTIRRIRTREIVIRAQHENNAYAWLLNYWLRFDFTKAEGEGHGRHRLGDQIIDVDYDAPVVPNI